MKKLDNRCILCNSIYIRLETSKIITAVFEIWLKITFKEEGNDKYWIQEGKFKVSVLYYFFFYVTLKRLCLCNSGHISLSKLLALSHLSLETVQENKLYTYCFLNVGNSKQHG